jgi:hypothetical protein
VVASSSQSLANLDSSSRCKLSSASNGSVNVVIMLHPTLRCVGAKNNRPWSAFAPLKHRFGMLFGTVKGSRLPAGRGAVCVLLIVKAGRGEAQLLPRTIYNPRAYKVRQPIVRAFM